MFLTANDYEIFRITSGSHTHTHMHTPTPTHTDAYARVGITQHHKHQKSGREDGVKS